MGAKPIAVAVPSVAAGAAVGVLAQDLSDPEAALGLLIILVGIGVTGVILHRTDKMLSLEERRVALAHAARADLKEVAKDVHRSVMLQLDQAGVLRHVVGASPVGGDGAAADMQDSGPNRTRPIG